MSPSQEIFIVSKRRKITTRKSSIPWYRKALKTGRNLKRLSKVWLGDLKCLIQESQLLWIMTTLRAISRSRLKMFRKKWWRWSSITKTCWGKRIMSCPISRKTCRELRDLTPSSSKRTPLWLKTFPNFVTRCSQPLPGVGQTSEIPKPSWCLNAEITLSWWVNTPIFSILNQKRRRLFDSIILWKMILVGTATTKSISRGIKMNLGTKKREQ